MPYNFMRASVTVSIFAGMSAIAGISVVIPNYNGEVLLPLVLPTVFTALHNAELPFEIIIVDDCSSDKSILLLKEKFSEIKVLQNNINSGFSITSNKGMREAKYDWVLLLNSDVKLEPDYFMPLLKYTRRDNVFGVMGRIVGWDNDTIQDGAKYPFFHGVKIKTSGNYLLKDKSAMADGLYSMYLSGANALMNKKIFIEIGGLNELFSPFYAEDFELSLRAWRLGYECYYEYNAVCRHQTSATIVTSNKKKHIKKIYNRNKMYLHAIHLSSGKRLHRPATRHPGGATTRAAHFHTARASSPCPDRGRSSVGCGGSWERRSPLPHRPRLLFAQPSTHLLGDRHRTSATRLPHCGASLSSPAAGTGRRCDCPRSIEGRPTTQAESRHASPVLSTERL